MASEKVDKLQEAVGKAVTALIESKEDNNDIMDALTAIKEDVEYAIEDLQAIIDGKEEDEEDGD